MNVAYNSPCAGIAARTARGAARGAGAGRARTAAWAPAPSAAGPSPPPLACRNLDTMDTWLNATLNGNITTNGLFFDFKT